LTTSTVFGFPGEAPVVPIQSRNLGLLDQRLAFDWVQKYISKFGGDPSQVTVFGQSAGARSADFHLLTMKNPPFRAVIMESGSAELTPLADSSRAGRSGSKLPPLVQLATALGCNSEEKMLDCMRQVSAQKIKETIATKRLYFGSTNDGGFTTVRDQAVIRRSHLAANVSLLIGTNSDEQRSLLGNWKDWKLDQYLNGKFSSAEMRVEVAKAYAVGAKSAYKSDFEAIAAVETDLAFTCITSREAKISAESGYRKYFPSFMCLSLLMGILATWRYLFSASAPKEGVSKSGSLHADEIPFVFGNLITQKNSFTPEHIALSKQMQQVWAQFAKYPNRGPGWSIVGTSENDLGKFGSDGKLVVQSSKGLDQNCKLFEKLYDGRA
jgi:carboxylesterase type B